MRCQDCKMISFESCATYGSFSGICLCNATLGKRWQQELNYWSRSSLQQTLNMKKSACLMTTKALLRAKVILRCCDLVHAFELRWIKLTRLRSRTISVYHPTNSMRYHRALPQTCCIVHMTMRMSCRCSWFLYTSASHSWDRSAPGCSLTWYSACELLAFVLLLAIMLTGFM